MAEDLTVISTIEDKVVILVVRYGPELMLSLTAHETLSAKLVKAYEEESAKDASVKTNSCIVMIEAETAGSPIVRALFELYKTVYAGSGQVICVGYPQDYIDSLTTLGLTGLAGFSLANTKQEALGRLNKPSAIA